jgi:hypothetical protein
MEALPVAAVEKERKDGSGEHEKFIIAAEHYTLQVHYDRIFVTSFS